LKIANEAGTRTPVTVAEHLTVQVSFDEGNDTVELQRLVHIHEDSS
jgi:hypothetical protein